MNGVLDCRTVNLPRKAEHRGTFLFSGIRKMQIVSNVALISINETFLVQLISFLIFLFIINRVMIRPLRGVMREREEYVEKLKRLSI